MHAKRITGSRRFLKGGLQKLEEHLRDVQTAGDAEIAGVAETRHQEVGCEYYTGTGEDLAGCRGRCYQRNT